MKKAILVLIVVVLLLSLCSCMPLLSALTGLYSSTMTEFFGAWVAEDDPYIAIIDNDGVDAISVDGEKIDIETILEEYHIPSPDFYAAVINGVLYLTSSRYCSEGEYRDDVEIWAIELSLGTAELLYKGFFTPRSTADSVGIWKAEYYYSDRNIVIYDGVRQVAFDIDTKTAAELPASDFSHPKQEYEIERYRYGEHNWIDSTKFKIINGSEERVITIEYMAQRHEYVRSLTELGMHEPYLWYEPIDPMEEFFETISVVGGRIYIVCRVLEYDGESNAVIFAYDYEEDKFTFLEHHFCGDIPHHYVIPSVNTIQ